MPCLKLHIYNNNFIYKNILLYMRIIIYTNQNFSHRYIYINKKYIYILLYFKLSNS